jgi:alanine racemase
MYGLWPSKSIEKEFSSKLPLCPAMRWVSHLAQVKTVPRGFPIGYGRTFVTKKEMRIGIVPQGYSDGYDRGFSNNSFVLVNGRACKVLGRVAMNMITVDLSRVSKAKLEDEVVLLGRQETLSIAAEHLADIIGSISYEIIARISPLLPRFIK